MTLNFQYGEKEKMQQTNMKKINIKAPVSRAKEGLKGYIGYEGYKV